MEKIIHYEIWTSIAGNIWKACWKVWKVPIHQILVSDNDKILKSQRDPRKIDKALLKSGSGTIFNLPYGLGD